MTNPADQITRSSGWSSWLPDESELAARWGRECLYVSREQPTSIFDLRDVRDVICDGRTTADYLTISTRDFRKADAGEYTLPTSGDQELAPQTSRIDIGKVADFLAAGSSLILSHVEQYNRAVARICNSLQRRTGRLTEAIAFLSPPGQGALPLHQDRIDVVVIQTSGTKHWQIFDHFAGQEGYGPVTKPAQVKPAHRLTLTPGDTCYMPAGRPHQTLSADAWSLHITFAISPLRPTRVLDETFHRALAELPDVDLHPGWNGDMDGCADMDKAVEAISIAIPNAVKEWRTRYMDVDYEYGQRRIGELFDLGETPE